MGAWSKGSAGNWSTAPRVVLEVLEEVVAAASLAEVVVPATKLLSLVVVEKLPPAFGKLD